MKIFTLYLNKFDASYLEFKKNRLAFQTSSIKKFSSLLGKKVAVTFGKEKIEGVAEDIDDNGSLVIKTRKGERVMRAGEVTVV